MKILLLATLTALSLVGCRSPDVIYAPSGDLTVPGGYHADWEPETPYGE